VKKLIDLLKQRVNTALLKSELSPTKTETAFLIPERCTKYVIVG